MNLFGIGPAELALIFMIMLVVAGPKRMIRWAYVVGRQVTKLRRMWGEAMTAIKKELEESGVDPEVTRTVEQVARMSRQDPANKARSAVRDSFKAFTQPLADAVEQIDKEVKDSVQLAPRPAAAPTTTNGGDSGSQLAPRNPASPQNADDSTGKYNSWTSN